MFSLIAGHSALASEALGWDLHTAYRPLSEGATLTTGWFWSDTYSDLRTERYVTYRPNLDVRPSIAYGSKVLKKNTLGALARYLESTGKRVVGGTNGDFFVVATGAPLGMVVTDGILRSSSSYHYAVGFRSDGTAFVGQPSLNIVANLPNGPVHVSGGVNKVRTLSTKEGGVTLLTEDFSDTTHNTTAGVDVYLTALSENVGTQIPAAQTPVGEDLVVSDQLRIGSRVSFRVDFVTEAAGANAIHPGNFVLTVDAADSPEVVQRLRNLQPGQEISIDIASADSRWNEVSEALGGMFRLLEDGNLGSGLKENVGSQQTARTAIGVKPDGTVIFYTLDGKQKGLSVGASCTQIAMRLQELGCVDAIGLDGGGSTTIGVTYPDTNAMEVVNSPVGGAQRAVSNAVFLTTDLQPTGTAGSLELKPGDAVLLNGMCLDLSAHALDTHWYDMGEASGVTYTADGAGTVTPEGHFLAQGAGGAVITGTLGALTGSASITVVDTPTELSITEETAGTAVTALALNPGETVALKANAVWRGFPLPSQDEAYLWTCDPATIGSITPDGTFTAGQEGGMGSLCVTAGETRVRLPVTVAARPCFLDMTDHWAERYADYLYRQGISNGVSAGDALLFQPESQITRAEFFTMTARWLGLDLSSYQEVALPFVDTEDIPTWALDAVRAMYAEGIVLGSQEESGLCARPDGLVSRAEAVTILGRTQEQREEEISLDAFPDAEEVPDWAQEYVKSFVGQGIVSGYEDGTLRPSEPLSRAQAAKIFYALRQES